MRNKTVQSFLRWIEKNTKKKLYIKIYSNGSGNVCTIQDDKKLLEFQNSKQLYEMIETLESKFE